MLITCATYNYVEMLTLLLASHEASNPDTVLHVHAIDWPDSAVANARKQYPRAVFHTQTFDIENGPQEGRGPVPRTAAILKLKVEMIYRAYHDSAEPVLWVDADTLLLAPLQPLVERVQNEGDFGVTYRAKKRDHAKFAVAVLCFVRTDAAARLLDAYVQGVRSSEGLVKRRDTKGVAWFHDQLGLWHAYRQLSRNRLGFARRDGPRLVALDQAEHSIEGSTQAIFVSRRDKLLDIEHMQAELKRRGIVIKPINS